jgi:hypothetical protein
MTAVLGHYGEKPAACGGEKKEIPPKGRWENARVDAHGLFHGNFHGIFINSQPTPGVMLYVVVCQNSVIVGWPSFKEAGDPAERVEIEVAHDVAPQEFLQLFGEQKYVRLPHRGSDKMPCFHLAPVPDRLLNLGAEFVSGACFEFPLPHGVHC